MSKRKEDEVRQMAEQSLCTFAVLVNPMYVYGDIHFEMFSEMEVNDFDQLFLLPRGHLKSHMIATWCAWWITKHPDTSILYMSGTEDLAISQLSAIKRILESDTHRRYWPEMIRPEEAMREQWQIKNIKVDHPARKAAGTRDATVAARSIDANTTGMHCAVLVLDDIVVPDNAYTIEGRSKVKAGYSQLSSVLNTGGITKVVGTRYHGDDIYDMMEKEEEDLYDEEGNVTGVRRTYTVYCRTVETDGRFLWPRAQHAKSGRWEGFDHKELARKRAKYLAAGERFQFYAQYYNDPQAQVGEDERMKFQYADRKYLKYEDADWFFQGKKLAVFCGADLAFTTKDTSDYTAFAVIGIDPEGFIYILDLDMFRTDKYHVYYDRMEALQRKWGFRKARIEINGGANLVAEYIKEHARKAGLPLAIDGKMAKGEKSERAAAILTPRYATNSVFHFRGGVTSTYEEQLTLSNPSHDDLRDAVCIAVEISRPPAANRGRTSSGASGNVVSVRFGGNRR